VAKASNTVVCKGVYEKLSKWLNIKGTKISPRTSLRLLCHSKFILRFFSSDTPPSVQDFKALAMAPTKYLNRVIPTISLRDYDARVDDITKELVDAAENVGFFCIIDHGISRGIVESMFENSARFCSLPDNVKSQVPFSPKNNAGWEKNAQIRPSTGAVDRKESYQMQFGAGMEGKWLDDSDLLGFKTEALSFMHQVQQVSERLMVCFARGLGFQDNYFVKAHDVTQPLSQIVARLLHYFATPEAPNSNGEVFHRAGAHTDWTFSPFFSKRRANLVSKSVLAAKSPLLLDMGILGLKLSQTSNPTLSYAILEIY
jgi:non-heme dioxygenase-like protein